MRFRASILLVGFGLLVSIVSAQAPPTTRAGDPAGSGRVGKYGDLAKLPIAGTAEIPTDEILRVLQRDLALQPLLSPAAPLDEFIHVLHRDLLAGYQASGFRDAAVDVRLDANGNPLVVGITEGPRYQRGPIRVEGAKTIDPARLIGRLTALRGRGFITEIDPDLGVITVRELGEAVDEPYAVWKEGTPASFRDANRRSVIGKVREALAGMGYFRANFLVDYVVVGQLVELRIRIIDEGPRATLADVEVRGAVRVDRNDVMEILQLRTGTPIDLDRLSQIQQVLWDGGRFKRHVLGLFPHEDGGGAVRLRMELVENENVPSLKEPLAPVHEAMLKAGRWLEKLPDSDHDLVFRLETPRGPCELVISPQNGWVVALRSPPGKGEPPATSPAAQRKVELGAAARGAKLAFYSAARGVQVHSALPITRVKASIDAVPDFSGENGRWFSFKFAAGVNYSTDERKKGPIDLVMTFAATYLLAEVKRFDFRLESREGAVVLRTEQASIELDPQTGQLKDALFSVSGYSLRATTERGAFARLVAEMSAAAPEVRAEDHVDGLRTVVDFCLGIVAFTGIWEPDTAKTPALQSLARLIAPAIAPLLPRGPVADPPVQKYGLLIPVEPGVLPIAAPSGVFTLFAASYADQIAPRGTWAWTIYRESILLLDGITQSTNRELLRLYEDPRTGPLACLVIAHSPIMRDNPNTRGLFARAGLRKLTADAAIGDLRVLWEGNGAGAQVVAQLARELSRMDAAEVQALASELPEDWGNALNLFAAALRTMPNQPPEQAIPRAIQLTWDPGLRKPVQRSLGLLADAPPPGRGG